MILGSADFKSAASTDFATLAISDDTSGSRLLSTTTTYYSGSPGHITERPGRATYTATSPRTPRFLALYRCAYSVVVNGFGFGASSIS